MLGIQYRFSLNNTTSQYSTQRWLRSLYLNCVTIHKDAVEKVSTITNDQESQEEPWHAYGICRYSRTITKRKPLSDKCRPCGTRVLTPVSLKRLLRMVIIALISICVPRGTHDTHAAEISQVHMAQRTIVTWPIPVVKQHNKLIHLASKFPEKSFCLNSEAAYACRNF